MDMNYFQIVATMSNAVIDVIFTYILTHTYTHTFVHLSDYFLRMNSYKWNFLVRVIHIYKILDIFLSNVPVTILSN